MGNLFGFKPSQIEKVSQRMKLMAADEHRKFPGERRDVFRSVDAIDQRDG